MGELVGYVTRSRGAANLGIFGVTSGTAEISRNQFVAYKAGAIHIDSYATLAEARGAVERCSGSGLLKWQLVNLPNQIEHWEGRSTDFYPGDLGDLLVGGGWWRADKGTLGPNALLSNVRRWLSHDGSEQPDLIEATQATAADQPTLVEVAAGGRPALAFDPTTTEYMGTNLTIGTPMTIFAVADYQLAAHGGDQIVVQSPRFSAYIDAGAGGDRWTFSVAAGAIAGPVVTAGRSTIISAICNTVLLGGVEMFIDGTSQGTMGQVAPVDTVTISDAANSWGGHISELLLVPAVLGLPKHNACIEYFSNRYNIDT